MWKPWIFVAIGTALVANTQALISPHAQAALAQAGSQNGTSGYTSYPISWQDSVCADDIKNACGAQQIPIPAMATSSVLTNKKGVYASTGNEKADLVNSLKNAIGSLATPLPGNFNGLVANVVASTDQDIQSTNMDGVDGVLAGWGLPQQVQSFLSNIKFSEDITYQTYRFALQVGETRLQEFIASGKNNGGNIVIAFMKVDVSGSPIQQYIRTQNCHRNFLGRKKCNDVYNPRGFTTDELNSMQNGLLFHGYNKLMAEVDSLSNYMLALEAIEPHFTHALTATDGQTRNWLERAIIESYKNLKSQFEGETKTEVVKKITNLGFNSFVEDAEIKFIKNMDGKYIDAFTANLVSGLDIDDINRQKISEYMEFIAFTDIGQWNMYRSMYSVTQPSNANYICLMTYKNEDNKFSIYVVQMKNSFEVAPDILILKNSKSSFGGLFSKSTENVVRIPHAMTPQDLQQLLDYFDLIAFERFMKLFGQNPALESTSLFLE